jgi:hypothetical protein
VLGLFDAVLVIVLSAKATHDESPTIGLRSSTYYTDILGFMGEFARKTPSSKPIYL